MEDGSTPSKAELVVAGAMVAPEMGAGGEFDFHFLLCAAFSEMRARNRTCRAVQSADGGFWQQVVDARSRRKVYLAQRDSVEGSLCFSGNECDPLSTAPRPF